MSNCCKLPGTYDCPNCMKLIQSYCEGMEKLGTPVAEDRKCRCEEKVSEWDFNTALGDTIREKYESLYVKIVEVSNVINRKVFSTSFKKAVANRKRKKKLSMDIEAVKKAMTPQKPHRKLKWTFEGFDSKGKRIIGPEFIKMISRPCVPKPLEKTWTTSILFHGQRDDESILKQKLQLLDGGFGTLKLYDTSEKEVQKKLGSWGRVKMMEPSTVLVEECDLDLISVKKMGVERFPDGYDLTLHMDCADVYYHEPFGANNEVES